MNEDDDKLNSVSSSSVKLKVNADTPELIHLGNLRNDTNDSNLSRRGKNSNESSPVRLTVEKAFINYDIKDKDTLSAIALKFRINVTELKQVNKIVADSDFFTRKTLKIPVQKHSFLRKLWHFFLKHQITKNFSSRGKRISKRRIIANKRFIRQLLFFVKPNAKAFEKE